MLDVFGVCDLYLTVFLLWRNAPAVAGRFCRHCQTSTVFSRPCCPGRD